jgi:hypothetical protein
VNSPEHLAQRFFDLVRERDRAGIAALLHPQITLSAQTIADDFVGREDVMQRFYDTVFAWTLYDAFADRIEHLDDDTVRATGRLRWMSNGHLHDVGAVWKLTFRDGQLFRLSSSTLADSRSAQLSTA